MKWKRRHRATLIGPYISLGQYQTLLVCGSDEVLIGQDYAQETLLRSARSMLEQTESLLLFWSVYEARNATMLLRRMLLAISKLQEYEFCNPTRISVQHCSSFTSARPR